MAKKSDKKKKSNKKTKKVQYVQVAPQKNSLIDGLRGLLPETASGQILTGLVIGGALTYIMSDEKLREKIIRMGVENVSSIVSSLAELREQIGDIQAEVAAAQTQRDSTGKV